MEKQDILNMLEPLSLEHKLGMLCRMYGSDNGNNSYRLSVRALKIIIDGRIAEEYEDLESPAPCQIDYIVVESSSLSPWFNMFTAFSTHFPLMSADKYAMGAAGNAAMEKILDYARRSLIGSKDIPENRLIEINRSSWLTKAAEGLKLKLGKGKKEVHDKEVHYSYATSDLMHMLDCHWACHGEDEVQKNAKKYNWTFKNRAEFKQFLIDSMDKKRSLFLRIKYPDYDTFFDGGYLSGQTTQRFLRWREVVPYIWEKAMQHWPDDKFNEVVKLPYSSVFTESGELKDKYK